MNEISKGIIYARQKKGSVMVFDQNYCRGGRPQQSAHFLYVIHSQSWKKSVDKVEGRSSLPSFCNGLFGALSYTDGSCKLNDSMVHSKN